MSHNTADCRTHYDNRIGAHIQRYGTEKSCDNCGEVHIEPDKEGRL